MASRQEAVDGQRPVSRAEARAAEAPQRDPEQVVAHEARTRPVAAILAAVGGILLLASEVVSLGIGHGKTSNAKDLLLYIHVHAGSLAVVAGLRAVGGLAVGAMLVLLYRMVRDRRPGVNPVARWLAALGGVGFAVTSIVSQIVIAHQAYSYVARQYTKIQPAKDLINAHGLLISQVIGELTTFALIIGFILICLNALKVGLLQRMHAYLGIVAGIAFLIPIGGIFQSIWLGALAALLLGRWPSEMPAAWAAGAAVPWPSPQEMRDRRMAQRSGHEQRSPRTSGNGGAPRTSGNGGQPRARARGQRGAGPSVVRGSVPTTSVPSPATSNTKRKRKKRR